MPKAPRQVRLSSPVDAGARVASLAELEGRFARFRRTHARGAWVPAELRAAVLASLDAGAVAGQLQRRCGISWTQIDSWKASREAARATGDEPSVRVLSVVDDQGEADCRSGNAETLELRLGSWSISVRRTGADGQGT